MIERLNQITLNDFIELSCGNYACLLSDCKSMSESTLKKWRLNYSSNTEVLLIPQV